MKKAIESVLSQVYKDFELIVVDDGSEDDTAALVSSFAGVRSFTPSGFRMSPRGRQREKTPRELRYIRQENKGPAAARNLGIKESAGDLVAFLDSDDWWDREKLAVQVREMQQNPNFVISHTQEVWYKNGRLLNQKKKHEKFPGYIFDKCLPLCVVSMSTAMMQRGLFDNIDLFDEGLPCCEDYDFWLRASVKHPFLLIDRPLTLKDGGRPDQVSCIYGTGIDKFRIQSIAKVLEHEDLNDRQRELVIHELQKKCRIYGSGCIKYGKVEEGVYYLGLPEKYCATSLRGH